MKQSIAQLTLTAGLVLIGPVTFAQDRGAVREAAQETATPDLQTVETQLDEAIATLEKKALAREASKEDYQRVQEHLKIRARLAAAELPEQRAIGQRLMASVDSLAARAQNAALEKKDFAEMRAEILDARTDRALILLEKKAEARGATPEDIQQLTTLVRARSENAAAEAADTSSLRGTYTGIMDQLKGRTRNAAISVDEVRTMRSQMIEARLDQSLANLERSALARKADNADFQRVKNHLNDRAALMQASATQGAQAGDLRGRTMKALEALQQRAQKGEVSREDFQQLRTQMVQRAHNAGQVPAEGTKAGEGAAEAGGAKRAGEVKNGGVRQIGGKKREGADGADGVKKRGEDARKKAEDGRKKAEDGAKKKTDGVRKKVEDGAKRGDGR